MEEITMEQEGVTSVSIVHKQKEAVCMTRSDSMSIGSIGSDVASVGGGSEEMDTEDSEKDPKEGFLRRDRSRSSKPQERRPKQSLDNITLPLDNQRETSYDLERITGDVTSPVIENKLSDDVSGYYAMRTSLLSQSAVILENGGAVGKTSSGRYQDTNCNVGSRDSGTRSSCEVRESSKLFHTGYTSGSDSESELEGFSCCMESTDEKHGNKNCNSKQEAKVSCAADLKVKTEAESDGEELRVDQHPESQSKDFTSLRSVKTESRSEGRLDIGGDDDQLRNVSVDILDGNASDSMAEIEKSGLEAKLARVSKRRVYSRARDLGQTDDSSSESDSDSESEDDEEEEKEMIFEDLHSATCKVLFNAAQPDSEKLIERDALKMACMDDLLSDCGSSEDSSDSSSEESSDSDDSSDSDLSSADDSDDEAEEEEEEEPKHHKGRQHYTISKEGLDQGLPVVEYLQISLPPSVQLTKVGYVSSIIGSLVIIQADQGSPALNIESVLFKSDRTVLGQVFELFGPVVSPFYSVRFNNAADIDQHEIKLKTEVFFAPQNVDVTEYVFTEQLKKLRGSDASWKNDEECPAEVAEFSDDEAESLARNKKKKERKRKVPQGRNESFQQGQAQWRQGNRQDQFHGRRNPPRAHPPLQRQPACRPPQFGPPHHHHNQHHQSMPRPTNQPGWMHNMGPPRGDFPFPPRQWHGSRPPGFPPGVPPMFQNLQATELPSGHQPPLMPMMQQQGFSARKIDGSAPMKQGASMSNPQMFSARETGITPPWQKKPPKPPGSWGGVPQPPSSVPSNPFSNPPSNQPVPPFPGFSFFSIPPPLPPGMPPPRGAADHAHKPPSLMEQPVLPSGLLPQSSPGLMQWNQTQSQTQFTPKFGSGGTPVSTSNFAPPPVPPPSFHPRMMQSFRRDTKTQNKQGTSQHW